MAVTRPAKSRAGLAHAPFVSIGGRGWLYSRQCGAFMHRHVVGRVARDLVLRIIDTASASTTFMIHIFGMDLCDGAVHITGLGVPAYVIAD